MSQAITVDDLRKQITRMKDRIFRLEKNLPSPEEISYIGATGQPAFANGWVNFDAGSPPPAGTARNAGFWKDRADVVHLTGLVKSGPSASAIFTLPAGYVPGSANHFYAQIGSGGIAQVNVFSDGTVTATNITANVTAALSLDGINFRAGS